MAQKNYRLVGGYSIFELKHFLPLISHYLPISALRDNTDFQTWMRNTPNLAHQFATEVLYNLPAPRQQHYQGDFAQMRLTVTSYLQQLEEFLGYYPVQITSDILDSIHSLEMGLLKVNLIFNLIKFIIVTISIIIIYSLLQSTAE